MPQEFQGTDVSHIGDIIDAFMERRGLKMPSKEEIRKQHEEIKASVGEFDLPPGAVVLNW